MCQNGENERERAGQILTADERGYTQIIGEETATAVKRASLASRTLRYKPSRMNLAIVFCNPESAFICGCIGPARSRSLLQLSGALIGDHQKRYYKPVVLTYAQSRKREQQKMKLTNILGQTNRSFASVFLAFSLFSFLFPHKANQVQQNHQVNLRTTEQATQAEPADDGSQYEWFY